MTMVTLYIIGALVSALELGVLYYALFADGDAEATWGDVIRFALITATSWVGFMFVLVAILAALWDEPIRRKEKLHEEGK